VAIKIIPKSKPNIISKLLVEKDQTAAVVGFPVSKRAQLNAATDEEGSEI